MDEVGVGISLLKNRQTFCGEGWEGYKATVLTQLACNGPALLLTCTGANWVKNKSCILYSVPVSSPQQLLFCTFTFSSKRVNDIYSQQLVHVNKRRSLLSVISCSIQSKCDLCGRADQTTYWMWCLDITMVFVFLYWVFAVLADTKHSHKQLNCVSRWQHWLTQQSIS